MSLYFLLRSVSVCTVSVQRFLQDPLPLTASDSHSLRKGIWNKKSQFTTTDYYRPQTKFAKVMFLHLSVSHSVHGGGRAWLQGGMHGCRGVHGWGACMVAGMCMVRVPTFSD